MTNPDINKQALMQRRLRAVRTVTVLLAFFIRILTPGWLLIIFGIPLLIAILIHVLVQSRAINKVPETKPAYVSLILLSNLFFFLGFVLQVDAGDDPNMYVPILYHHAFSIESKWPDIFSVVSAVSFLALVISWVALLALSNNIFKQKKSE